MTLDFGSGFGLGFGLTLRLLFFFFFFSFLVREGGGSGELDTRDFCVFWLWVGFEGVRVREGKRRVLLVGTPCVWFSLWFSSRRWLKEELIGRKGLREE